MTSKEVTDRSRSTRAVVSMLESYAESVGEGAAAELSAYLQEGESMPDIALFTRLLARKTDAARVVLETADEANEREQSDDAKPRQERDGFRESAGTLIVAIRDVAAANFGDVGLAALGLLAPCPGTPLGTARYGRALITALRDERVILPAPRTRSIPFDRAALAAELEELIVSLEGALRAVTREESEAKGTQTAKDSAMEANDEAFGIGTGIGRYLFRLCGLTNLADRIAESRRNPGRLEQAPPVTDTGPTT